MMRVMVVEDEEMIRKGIVMAVDWAAQIERVGQIRLEIALDEFDRALQLIDGQWGAVALRDKDLAHGEASLSYSVQKFTKYYTSNSVFMQVQRGNMQTFCRSRKHGENTKND